MVSAVKGKGSRFSGSVRDSGARGARLELGMAIRRGGRGT